MYIPMNSKINFIQNRRSNRREHREHHQHNYHFQKTNKKTDLTKKILLYIFVITKPLFNCKTKYFFGKFKNL